jgi:Leucine-rich repeat (LRR) protein
MKPNILLKIIFLQIQLAFVILPFTGTNAQSVTLFDPNTFNPANLQAGMSIVDIDGEKYLKAPLNGWNTYLEIDPFFISGEVTHLVFKAKYKSGTSGYTPEQTTSFFQFLPSDWSENVNDNPPSSAELVSHRIPFDKPSGMSCGIIQLAGRETVSTNWNVLVGDTIFLGKVHTYIAEPNVVFNPANYDQALLQEGMSVVEINGERYIKAALNNWNTFIEVVPFYINPEVTHLIFTAKYKSGTSGYTTEQTTSFFQFLPSDWSEYVNENPASSAELVSQRIPFDKPSGMSCAIIQLAGRETVSGNWNVLTGDTIFLGKIRTYSNDPTAIFDPNYFENVDLPAGMTIVQIENERFLKVITNGWNCVLAVPRYEITANNPANCSHKFSLGSLSSATLSPEQVQSMVVLIDNENTMPNPWGEGEIQARLTLVQNPAPVELTNMTGDFITEMQYVHSIQFAGQETVNWGPTTGDTLWVGKIVQDFVAPPVISHIDVARTESAPDLDGIIDNIWDAIDAVPIAKNFIGENPTVDAYWKAMWDDQGIYVLINVQDDNHFPAWEDGGNDWEYDHVEVFFDVNQVLDDNLGAGNGQGHYVFFPTFGEDLYDGEIINGLLRYANKLYGESYVSEMFFPFALFTNKDGQNLSKSDMISLNEIGFDIHIIDQDQGITTSRNRKVWQNVGTINENYFNMNDAGTIRLIGDDPYAPTRSDSLALVALYNSTGGSNWNQKENWLTGTLDTWQNVTVENGRVVGTNFGWNNNMVGTLPNDIGNLTAIKWFIASGNEGLTGIIPQSIGNLTNLQTLAFHNCNLRGYIPETITTLNKLETLELSFNDFDAAAMPDFGQLTLLSVLFIEGCNFTGDIPASFSNLTLLLNLNMNNNPGLNAGPIPDLSNSTNIIYLGLASCNLSGTIPAWINQLPNLETIDLYNNRLSNNLPDLSQMNQLETLNISNNKFTFANIAASGLVPGDITHFVYELQDTIFGIEQNGYMLTALDCGHANNVINWYRDGSLVSPNTETYEADQTGNYNFKVTNTVFNFLTLFSDTLYVEISSPVISHIDVARTESAPDLDGIIDNIWDAIDAVPIAKNFIGENPTVDAYWKAMWDDQGIYVLINVQDDNHFPAWEDGGNDWEYDHVEVFFDVNQVLDDNLGAGNSQGHYVFFPTFGEDLYDGEIINGLLRYANKLYGESYVSEMFFPFALFTNKDGQNLGKSDMISLNEIGFDIHIVDQDQGITTSRNRKVWQNVGTINENYFNMNDAGTIRLIGDDPYAPTRSDSLALVALYNSTGGSNWNQKENWLTGTLDTWQNVTVEDGRVVGLNFGWANNMVGTLPNDIENLTAIKWLIASGNEGLTGIIPHSIGNLTNLQTLAFYNCNLRGYIPETITTLNKLETLELSFNDFDAAAMPDFGQLTLLSVLFIEGCNFTGDIPASFSNLTSLLNLYMNNNPGLNAGTIPDLSNSTNIINLGLAGCNLIGIIPAWINQLPNLETIDLYNNRLSDNFPDLSQMNQLESLNISNNKFTFANIAASGLVPGDITHFVYELQDTIFGIEQNGYMLTALDCGHANNVINWYRDGSLVSPNTETYEADQTGNYNFTVTNTVFNFLTLFSDTLYVEVHTVPIDLNITPGTITAQKDTCFNAQNEIMVPVTGSVIIETGATALFIAGHSIRFLPGFHAQNGSTVKAWITSNGEFCDAYPAGTPVLVSQLSPEKSTTDFDNTPETTEPGKEPGLKVYPNPNNGQFSIKLSNIEGNSTVHLFNAQGQLLQTKSTNDSHLNIDIPNPKPGIYFVKTIYNGKHYDKKILVQ